MSDIREYEPAILPTRGMIERVMGPSQATLDFEEELEQDGIKRYLGFLWDDMASTRNNIRKQLGETEKYNNFLLQKVNLNLVNNIMYNYL